MKPIFNMSLIVKIKKDLFRIAGKDNFVEFLRRILGPGFRQMFFFRLSRWCKRIPLINLLIAAIYRLHSEFYGFQIPPNLDIGDGIYIGHYGTIIINANAKLGSNINLTTNVLIGQTNRGKLKGAPTIGNNVYLGYGCVVVGNIKVGNNVLIAANAYVNQDVPDNSIVIGNPASIITNKLNATESYVNNTI